MISFVQQRSSSMSPLATTVLGLLETRRHVVANSYLGFRCRHLIPTHSRASELHAKAHWQHHDHPDRPMMARTEPPPSQIHHYKQACPMGSGGPLACGVLATSQWLRWFHSPIETVSGQGARGKGLNLRSRSRNGDWWLRKWHGLHCRQGVCNTTISNRGNARAVQR